MSFYLRFVTDFDPWFSNRGTNFQIGKHALSQKSRLLWYFFSFFTYLLRDVLSICRTLISQILFPMVLAPKVKDKVAMSPGRFPRSTYTLWKERISYHYQSLGHHFWNQLVRLFRQFIILLNTILCTSYMKSYLFEKMIICTLCFAPDTELLLLWDIILIRSIVMCKYDSNVQCWTW